MSELMPLTTAPQADGTQARESRNGGAGVRTGAQRRRPRWLRRLLGLATLVAAAVALRLTLFTSDPIPVHTLQVVRGTVEETVTNTRAGTIKARRRARLSPETGGRVVALPRLEGARVAAGALLVRLDGALQRAQVDVAGEDVHAARARIEETCFAAGLAEKELQRVVELRKGGIASQQAAERAEAERDRTRAACRGASAQFDQAKARRRLGEATLAQTDLRAPFSGVVAEVNTELGEWITPAPPGIMVPPAVEVIDPSSLFVTAPIDEMDAERVRPGQEVRLSVDSRRGEHFAGHVVRVAPYVQDLVQQNRTIEVEAEFEDRALAARLLPGTSADVEIVLSRRANVLQVPTGAIGQGAVLVARDGRLLERPVRTGLRNWRTTEVQEGLREGDRVVVTRDSPGIKAGARVAEVER